MTEEIKQSSEVKDEDLAQEALDATASTDESDQEPKVPLHEHTALRRRAQDAEIRAARSEGELTAIRQQQATSAPAAKSPLDVEIERQAALGIAEDEMSVSPNIIRANDVYNRQVANRAAEVKAAQDLQVVQTASFNKAKVAHEDWQDVVAGGDGLLSRGQLLDITAAGEGCGELYYAQCQAAIERNKPESKSEPAPETKQSESESEVPTQQEILKGLDVDPASEAAMRL